MAKIPLSLQDKLRTKLTKKFGNGSVSNAADRQALAYIPYGISPQCLTLDLLIGRPGFPSGRLTEICALEHRGKSTLGYHVLAQCQRQGGVGVLIETENAFEASRLETLGVDTENLVLLQPTYIEEALDMILQTMIGLRVDSKFTGPLVIILDTVARTPSSAEFEGNFDQQHMAHAARVISQGLRKLVRPLGMHKAVLIFMNQLTHTMNRYGDQLDSYGGQSIKSTASLRIQIEYLKKDLEYSEGKKAGELQGARIKAYTMKNKLSLPFQTARYYLNFHTGIDQVDDLWTSAMTLGALRPSKGTFSFTLGKNQTLISRDEWEGFIMSKFKTTDNLREKLSNMAVEKGKLRLYGS